MDATRVPARVLRRQAKPAAYSSKTNTGCSLSAWRSIHREAEPKLRQNVAKTYQPLAIGTD